MIQLFDKDPSSPPNPLARIYGAVCISATVLGFLSKLVYRKYILSHHIADFGLSDSLPSFFYVVGISYAGLFYYQMKRRATTPGTIVIASIATIVYETEQFLFHSGSFDMKDIIATLLGATIAYFLYIAARSKYAVNTQV